MDRFDSLFEQGHALIERQMWDKAIEKLEKAAKLDPSYAELWFELAVAYEEVKQIGSAIDSYHKALEIEPDNIRILNNLGNLYRKIEDFSKAEQCYDNIFEINPNSLVGWFSYSEMLKSKGNLEGAIEGAKKTIELAENQQNAYFLASGHYNLACYLALKDRKESAREHLEKAIEIDPNLEEIAREDADLFSLNFFE
jgi:tetratricopeptide (TPR) repeat protein